jgi:neutral amino acid transport system permease protein
VEQRRATSPTMAAGRLLLLVGFAAVIALLLASPAEATGTANETVQGRLVDAAGTPVEGVEVVVEESGREVGRGTSDATGQWSVAVPAAGDYTVTLQTDTLPEGGSLRQGSTNTREVTVNPGQPRNVLFPLGAVEDVEPGLAAKLAQRTVDGLLLGALIGMTAVGLSLIFGTTGLINFAHGELVTTGAVVAYLLNAAGLHVAVAALAAIPAVALLAGATHRFMWRPMRRRGVSIVSMFIATIGLALVLRQTVLIVYGGDPRRYEQYSLQRTLQVGPITMTPRDLVILVASLVVLLLVGVLLTRTRLGTAIRSVADNRDLAGCTGIDVERVVVLVWVIGGGLAALGGVLYGLNQAVTWNMGLNLLLLMFAGVILGGLGTAFGAVLGSLVVGLLAQLSTAFFDSELQIVWALGILIVVLLVRPQGLLGRRERVG